jgi:hypothetical protein
MARRSSSLGRSVPRSKLTTLRPLATWRYRTPSRRESASRPSMGCLPVLWTSPSSIPLCARNSCVRLQLVHPGRLYRQSKTTVIGSLLPS